MKNSIVVRYFVEGKKAKGSNFFTDGETATSYTTPIASKANGLILIASTYRVSSVYYCGTWFGKTASTERHKNYIKRTADYYVEVPEIFPYKPEHHTQNIEFLRSEAEKASHKAMRARTLANVRFWERVAEGLLEDMNLYKKAFNL